MTKLLTKAETFKAAVDAAFKAVQVGENKSLAIIPAMQAAITDMGITPCRVVDYSSKGINDWCENRLAGVSGIDWKTTDANYKALIKKAAAVVHYDMKVKNGLFVNNVCKPNAMGRCLVNHKALPSKYQNKDGASQQGESFSSLVKIAQFGLWGKAKESKSILQAGCEVIIKAEADYDSTKEKCFLSASEKVALRKAIEAASNLLEDENSRIADLTLKAAKIVRSKMS